MIIRINHPDISGNEKTYLTTSCSAGATTLTVQNIEGFSVGEYVVLGKIGEEQSEIVRIHTSTTPTGSTITLNAGTTFAHTINTPVTYIPFNQVALYSASTKTGTYSIVGSATNIEADQLYTEINDSSGSTTTWYKTRYYNSITTTWSSYSDLVKGTGYTEDSLRKIIDKANALSNDRNNKALTEDEKIDIVNDGYQFVNNRLEKADHKRFLKKGYIDVKNSYDTGSASVSVAGTTVTGTGTSWNSTWTYKKIIFEDKGFPYEIASTDHTTQLTLTRAFQGEEALSGVEYTIFQDEYIIYDELTGEAVADFKKVERVVDKDGNEVNEFDLNRSESGYFLKREDDNLRLCLNYIPSTTDAEGRWTIWYRYQPTKLDSMADEPEFPQGYSGILVSYLSSKIWERKGDMTKAAYYIAEFTNGHNNLIGEATPRTNEKKGFRLDRNLTSSSEHDEDWGDAIYSRDTISGTQFS